MKKERVLVFAGGMFHSLDFYKKYLEKKDAYLVAVDRGLTLLNKFGISPDMFVGDLDSCSQEDFLKEKNKIKTVKLLRSKKNKSDLEVALAMLKKNKFKSCLIFGATGGRIDHLFFNIFLLKKFYKYFQEIKIIDQDQEIFLVDKEFEFKNFKGKTVSFLSVDTGTRISLEGFEYNLNKKRLYSDSTLTLSNIIKENRASIRVHKGKILVFLNYKLNI